ncbi:MAG: sugar phosphate isomerase/epimerase [Armatimonadetes bacterium]|nr:sugar phosphate isomerase/epimerase [Armatimonadota bacterium]MDE2206194.1 sugar phosphate isomerase/epimerase [Armatimonadota bacterium]
MTRLISRRQLVTSAAGAAAAVTSGLASDASAKPKPQKSVMWTMLPASLPVTDRFQLAHTLGFAGVEIPPVGDRAECESMRSAAAAAGIRIQSVIYGGWDAPLSSPDAAVVQLGLKNAMAAMHTAAWVGADDILLVPALVTDSVRYVDAWRRSIPNVRRLLDTAEKLNVMILIEEVWNHFLLSPIEYTHYIDQFRHPLIQSYFDVGNVVIFGWPEDWIRTLGKRIRKVHLKDFKRSDYQFVPLWEGDVNWSAVGQAFAETGFTGFMNTELPGGDEAYLRDVSARVDRIIAQVKLPPRLRQAATGRPPA